MKIPLTPEIRNAANDMLDRGETRHIISSKLGLTLGQVAALAAHRTIRNSKTSPTGKQPQIPVHDSHDPQPNSNTDSKMSLGKSSDGEDVSWHPSAEPNPHLLVVGESGSGKTFAISSIVGKLCRHNLSSIVFDFGQGFDKSTLSPHLSGLEDAVHIDLARLGSALNPLAFSPTDPYGPLTSAQRIADALCRVFPNLGIQQNAVLREALIKTYERSGIKAEDPRTWELPPPTFELFGITLREWSDDRLLSSRKTAESLYAHISSLFLFRLFRTDGTTLNWEKIALGGHLTVVHLRGLSPELQRTLTEFLLWSLIASVETYGPDELKLFVILDEAHRIPSSAGAALDFLLREGRKYGIATIVGSQQPEDFSSVCLTNTATKLVFNVGEQKPGVLRRLFRGATSSELQMLQSSVSKLGRGTGYLVNAAGIRRLTIDSV